MHACMYAVPEYNYITAIHLVHEDNDNQDVSIHTDSLMQVGTESDHSPEVVSHRLKARFVSLSVNPSSQLYWMRVGVSDMDVPLRGSSRWGQKIPSMCVMQQGAEVNNCV